MLLASLQAVVIYTIILLAPSTGDEKNSTSDDEVSRKVETFVLHVVRSGLFLSEERAQTRPSWEAWVYVTAKRRAILALYLLHWAYSFLHEVPCFDCRDLGFMPAPAPKALWQAHTENEWNTKYIHWLARWSGQIYLQAEFGHIQPGAGLSPRAERWLGEADEFGFIMASIRKFLQASKAKWRQLTFAKSMLQTLNPLVTKDLNSPLLSRPISLQEWAASQSFWLNKQFQVCESISVGSL